MLRLLNLGCGSRFSRDPRWINIDFNSQHKEVISHDLRKGIPFADQSVDAVYLSHFLEHLNKEDAMQLVKECFSVLKPGGVIRVIVPDLENICRIYLDALEKAMAGDAEWQEKYEWIMLEMYDQVVRAEPGGEMLKYLNRFDLHNKDFIIGRIGSVARDILKPDVNKSRPIWKRFIRNPFNNIRAKGEKHKWMYDRYSLRRLLESADFTDIRQCTAKESRISDWIKYFLDINSDGFVHAPSSLYMEGIKPE